MKTLYALPCACGRTLDVERSQAGLLVRCECGREIEVPTIRGLAELEQRVSSAATQPSWGPRQGVIFLGLAIFAGAACYAGYRHGFPPPAPFAGVNEDVLAQEIDSWTPAQTWEMWTFLSQGMDQSEFRQMVRYRARLDQHLRWTRVVWGVAALGLVIAIAGGLLVGNPRGQPARQAPRRSSPA